MEPSQISSDPLARGGGRPRGVLPVCVAVAVTAACWSTPAPEAAHVADRIIAVVNTEVIMLSELKAESEGEARHLKERYRGEELQRRLQQLEYIALTRMIEHRLQMQLAKTKGVDVSDDEIKSAAQELQRQGEKVDASDPKHKNSIKEQLMLMRVVDREVRSAVMVSDTEVRRYFDQHQSLFALPEEYRISQILIRPRSGERPADVRSRAAAVSAALKQGADFSDLALRRSDGPEAIRGGDLGFVRQGELLPPLERVLSALAPGRISEPLETSQGLHIIRLDEKRPPQFRPFVEVKNDIQTLVFKQKGEDIYQRWMADLKKKAYIEVKF